MAVVDLDAWPWWPTLLSLLLLAAVRALFRLWTADSDLALARASAAPARHVAHRTLLISGASAGIGAQLAFGVARCNAHSTLLLLARRGARLDAVAARCRRLGPTLRVGTIATVPHVHTPVRFRLIRRSATLQLHLALAVAHWLAVQ